MILQREDHAARRPRDAGVGVWAALLACCGEHRAGGLGRSARARRIPEFLGAGCICWTGEREAPRRAACAHDMATWGMRNFAISS